MRATSQDGSFADSSFSIALNDLDEFNVGAVTDSDGNADTVAENATNGTVVGITALASDADATTNAITYSLTDDANGRFTIDGNTGVITVADGTKLDFENATSHGIIVKATSQDGSFSVQNYTIQLSDVNESAITAVSDNDANADFVMENSSLGTTVGVTGWATDADGTDVVTYTLDDDASGRFTIDSNTGVVTVAGAIDREAAGSYDIVVRATSTDSSTTTKTFTIQVGDVDEFNVGAVTDNDGNANSVAENATIGTVVGITGLASDGDATNNVITYSLFDNDGGRFTIDANSGVVTVAGAIDREADGPSRTITVRATSQDGSFTDQNFSISIVDVDEFNVTAPIDSDGASNTVTENMAIGTTVGITGSAIDSDATTNGVTYSLFDDDGGNFTIDANTGVVTTAKVLDRESLGGSRSITLRSTSQDGSFADTVFTIAIQDVDEFNVGAVSDSDATANLVAENASLGTVVGITDLASDGDATNNVITYSLFDNDGGRFTIDANSGVVTVAGAIDREADGPSRTITVRATSQDGSFTDQNFNISIADIDEFDVTAPVDTDGGLNQVNENAAIGTLVGITVLSSDSDATANGVTYSLFDDDGGNFTVDANTGVVSTAKVLDRESLGGSRSITVRSTSQDGSFADSLFTIQLNDIDEFDVGAVSDSNSGSNRVADNAGLGTLVGITASAQDGDATNNGVSFSLFDDDGGRFAIDANTGVVTVNGTIDREADGPSERSPSSHQPGWFDARSALLDCDR